MANISVREATIEDLGYLVESVEKMDKFYPNRKHSYFKDAEYSASALQHFISEHFMLVAECAGKQVGFIGGFISPHVFNPDVTCLTQILWWVNDDYRFSRVAHKLLRAFNSWGTENADVIFLNTHKYTRIHERNYERFGFEEYERVYVREV